MRRPQPRYAPPEIVAGVRLHPQGAHELEVAIPSGIVAMRFSRDQVVQLERAIARFKEQVAFEDGRTVEAHRHKFIALEVS